MPRAFTPPPTLTNEHIKTIADVRRRIWTEGFKGMAIGGSLGLVSHALLSIQSKFLKTRSIPFTATRNTLFASVMLGGSLGMFLGSVITGKNEVHNLHEIYPIGARPNPALQQQQTDEERNAMLRNRVFRRKTLQQKLSLNKNSSENKEQQNFYATETSFTKEK